MNTKHGISNIMRVSANNDRLANNDGTRFVGGGGGGDAAAVALDTYVTGSDGDGGGGGG